MPAPIVLADVLSNPTQTFIAGKLPVSDEPHQLFVDPFDQGSSLNTTDLWQTPVTAGGGVTAALASGQLTIGTGTTGSGYSYLLSAPAFRTSTPGWVRFAANVAAEFPIALNGYRAFGAMAISGAVSPANPLGATGNGCVFEIGNDGNFYAALYKNGVRTQIALDAGFNDSGQHNLQIFYRPTQIYWYHDGILVGQTNVNGSNLNVDTLSVGYLAVANTSPPGVSLVLTSDAVSVSDTSKNNVTMSDVTYPFRRAEVFRPAGALDPSTVGAHRMARKGKVLFDSGALTTLGANTGVMDVTGLEEIYVVVANGDAATRALTLDTYLDDGTTNVDAALLLFAATNAAQSRGVIGRSASGALGTPALNFSFPITLPTKMKLSLAAGTTSARLTVWGR